MRKPSRLPLKLLCFGLYGLVLALFMRTELNCLIRHFTGVICPGCGMSRAWKEACDLLLRIPIYGAASSLNVGCAASICLYEIARQRDFDGHR